MDIRHLKYFAEVARHASFTKAASTLHVSQPTLSKAVKAIEEELGVPLFYRSSTQLELTDAGKAVLANTKIVLDAFNNLTAQLTDLMELQKGEIRIGIPPIMAANYIADYIIRFKESYPLIDITLSEAGSKIIKQEVADGELDVGFVCNLPVQKDQFHMKHLVRDPLMLIVHREHRLAAKKKVSFSEIKDEPFIQYRNDFTLHDRIMEECSKNGFYPNIVCESSQKELMIEMVQANMGAAFLPSNLCEKINHPHIVAIPLQEQSVSLELGMIWRKNRHLPFAVREFIAISEAITKMRET